MKIQLVRNLYEFEEPEDIPFVLPVRQDESGARTQSIETLWGLFDVLLKAPARLDGFIREKALRGKLLIWFALIVLISFTLHALAMFWLICSVPEQGVPEILVNWDGSFTSALGLFAVYPLGMLLSALVCLPSYYYVAMLSGLRMPPVEVLLHSLKGKASTSILLAGVLPLYVLLIYGLILLGVHAEVLKLLLYFGLALPIALGLRGAVSIYSGFRYVVNQMSQQQRRQRYHVPDLLIMMWALLFLAVTPFLMFKLWETTGLLMQQ